MFVPFKQLLVLSQQQDFFSFLTDIWKHSLIFANNVYSEDDMFFSERHLYKKLVSPDYCTLGTLHEGEVYASQGISKIDRLGLLISGR